MAPINPRDLYNRSLDSGSKFTVIFVAVAATVVVAGLLWAYLPNIRAKYLPPSRPSRTRYNDESVQGGLSNATVTSNTLTSDTLTVGATLSHCPHAIDYYSPAVLDFPVPALRSYIRDTPSSSPNSNCVREREARTYSSPRRPYSSAWNPIAVGYIPRPHSSLEHLFETLSESDSNKEIRTPVQSKDFGDAKGFILAIPEPLSVRSQDKQAQFLSFHAPASTASGKLSSSATSDKLLHPNKLFKQIEAQGSAANPKTVATNDVQNKSELKSCDLDKESVDLQRTPLSTSNNICKLKSKPESQTLSAEQSLVSHDDEDDEDDEDETSPHNASIAAMHRLKTYRSLVGAPTPEPLTRAGTLTRPKTPVAEIRNLYDRGISAGKSTVAISRNNTVSTNFGTATSNSDEHSSMSSSTSPPKTAPGKFTISAASLLPTPLRVVRSSESYSATSPVRTTFSTRVVTEHAPKSTFTSFNNNPPKSQNDGLLKKCPAKLALSNRPRPAPLKIGPDVQGVNSRLANISRARAQVCDVNNGLKRQVVASMQASSTYSRNTQGQSIAHTPAMKDIHNSATTRMPFTPATENPAEAEPSSGDSTESNLAGTRDRASKVSKLIIDNWKAHMDDVDFDTSPSPSLKRALSNLGAGCSTQHTVLPGDEHGNVRDSTISTEFAPSELGLSDSIVSALRISASSQASRAAILQRISGLRTSVSDTSLTAVARGPAPGDARWV